MKPDHLLQQIINGLTAGDIRTLSRAVTLVESQLEEDQQTNLRLMKSIAANRTPAVKIGITGSPGVGKSTFLNGLVSFFEDTPFRVGILTIDPSSIFTGGSILGDKLRMKDLMNMDNVYVRTSPSKVTLGGINLTTWETVLLCEVAGFDYIFVETVGVGQSEIEVQFLVNEIWYLTMDRSGDESQGIKRGILEIADRIIVTKNDLDPEGARQAKAVLKQSINTKHTDEKEVAFYSVSSVIKECLVPLFRDLKEIKASPWSVEQTRFWFDKGWKESVMRVINSDARLQHMYGRWLADVESGAMDYWSAMEKLEKGLEELWRK